MQIDIKKDTFNKYGNDYQLQLFRDMMNDKAFGYDIIEKIEPNYFSDRSFITIMKLIKEYYRKHDTLPSVPELSLEVKMKLNGRGIEVEQVIDTIENIQKCATHNQSLKDSALKFCKLKSLDSAITSVKKRIEKGIVEDYDDIEDILKETIIRNDRSESTSLYYDIEAALDDDYRHPIRTGIQGFDDLLDGGLGLGEVGLIIAPLGVGKTTLITKIANTAYLQGKNVLQIFFEDPVKAIQRKHLTAFSGVGLHQYKEESKLGVIRMMYPAIKNKLGENEMILQKYSSDTVTMQDIKNLIKRTNNRLSLKNQQIDVVLIDYLECLDEKGGKEDWSNEGKIMRKIEALAAEENFACWVATQGNRESISTTEVTSDKSGGSIKKAQIAHFVVGVGKLNEQKDNQTATIVINKNRFGDDGIVFSDCTFINRKLFINTNKDRSSIAAFQREKQKKASRSVNN